MATTPRAISPAVRSFCSSLSSEEPIYLSVTPEPYAHIGKCYLNAEFTAHRLSGRMVFGWLIWEQPGVYLTAEHHAVAEVEGQFIDVTPQFNAERSVLFVPDHITDFKPPRPANRYTPLSNDPRIARFLELKRKNAVLDRDLNFGLEFQRNDAEATRLLESFLGKQKVRVERAANRKRKKAERQRRKRNR